MTLLLLLRTLWQQRLGVADLGVKCKSPALDSRATPTALAAAHACPLHAGHSVAAYPPAQSPLDQVVAGGQERVASDNCP